MTGIRKPRDVVTCDPDFVSRQRPSQFRILPGITLMNDKICELSVKSMKRLETA